MQHFLVNWKHADWRFVSNLKCTPHAESEQMEQGIKSCRKQQLKSGGMKHLLASGKKWLNICQRRRFIFGKAIKKRLLPSPVLCFTSEYFVRLLPALPLVHYFFNLYIITNLISSFKSITAATDAQLNWRSQVLSCTYCRISTNAGPLSCRPISTWFQKHLPAWKAGWLTACQLVMASQRYVFCHPSEMASLH